MPRLVTTSVWFFKATVCPGAGPAALTGAKAASWTSAPKKLPRLGWSALALGLRTREACDCKPLQVTASHCKLAKKPAPDLWLRQLRLVEKIIEGLLNLKFRNPCEDHTKLRLTPRNLSLFTSWRSLLVRFAACRALSTSEHGTGSSKSTPFSELSRKKEKHPKRDPASSSYLRKQGPGVPKR